MDLSSKASGELLRTVSNMVTSDKSVVTSKTIRPKMFHSLVAVIEVPLCYNEPGTIVGIIRKLPQEITVKRVDGR